ncbi:hypothetical protein DENSPDRAFT_928316 [Dentipellis sp. KUC8613]|nr:hypothetical protein DENSPDRAFT_928316 [Dentipellis sp. KUC8613]
MSYNQSSDQDFQRSGLNRTAGSQAFDDDERNLNAGLGQGQQGQWDSGNQGQQGFDQGQWDSDSRGRQSQPGLNQDYGSDPIDDQYARDESQYDRGQNWQGQRGYDERRGQHQHQHQQQQQQEWGRDDQSGNQKPSLTEKVKGTAEKLVGKSKGDSSMAQRGEQRKRGDADF